MGKIVPVTLLVLGFVCSSCSTESSGISPFASWFQNGNAKLDDTQAGLSNRAAATMFDNTAAANLMKEASKSPNVSDAKTKKELAELQSHIKNYLKAFEDFNESGKKRYEKAIRKSYQSIQARRTSLPKKESEKLKGYLVRVKSNFQKLQHEFQTVEISN